MVRKNSDPTCISSIVLILVLLVQGTTTRATLPVGLTPEQQDILSHFSIVFRPDGLGGFVKTIGISGVNLQIVNGLGSTNGFLVDPFTIDPLLTQTNGTGNLIIGYNELGNVFGDNRTGSHNLIVGQGNSFSSFGGFVAARENTVSSPFGAVSGGKANQAMQPYSSVLGGLANRANGLISSVSGGSFNQAYGNYSNVAGGISNQAIGAWSSVSGGNTRVAPGIDDWVAGALFQNN